MLPTIVMSLGFKEIIWDMGWIWVLILVMSIAFIFEEIRYILQTVKPDKILPRSKKPRYEVIFRKRLE